MKKSNKVIAIIGATATGKSDYAIKLAQELDTEIISADSRLVYKGFDIGTAKPTKEELSFIKHHCVDMVEPNQDFSVSDFKKTANKAMQAMFDDNKTPIVAGGTGFYIKSLLGGLDIPEVQADENFRKEMRQIAQEKGNDYLYQILKDKDIEITSKIHQNDVFRVIRALEVIEKTGIKMSEAQKVIPLDFEVEYLSLEAHDREFLYNRINLRVDKMIKDGLIEETQTLLNQYGEIPSILKTLGYKEVCLYLKNQISKDEMIELIKKDTRNFAKRQLTWFRPYEAKKIFIDD